MNSTMDRESHHRAVQRALALGRSADPGALAELACLLATPSAEVRRLAASAIGKLAGFGADPAEAVRALAPVALHDPQPPPPEMLAPMSSTFDTFFRAATGLHLTGEATATQAGNTPLRLPMPPRLR